MPLTKIILITFYLVFPSRKCILWIFFQLGTHNFEGFVFWFPPKVYKEDNIRNAFNSWLSVTIVNTLQ